MQLLVFLEYVISSDKQDLSYCWVSRARSEYCSAVRSSGSMSILVLFLTPNVSGEVSYRGGV